MTAPIERLKGVHNSIARGSFQAAQDSASAPDKSTDILPPSYFIEKKAFSDIARSLNKDKNLLAALDKSSAQECRLELRVKKDGEARSLVIYKLSIVNSLGDLEDFPIDKLERSIYAMPKDWAPSAGLFLMTVKLTPAKKT